MTDTPAENPRDQIARGVNAEIDKRTEAIAATAAAQIEQANRDAEAIARAAQQSRHVARVDELEGRIGTWKSDLETQIAATKAETTAAMENLRLSILSQLPKAPETTIVEAMPALDTSPTVSPENEGGEQENRSRPTAQPDESRQDQSRQVEARKRAVL